MLRKEAEADEKYDTFFVSIYAGSREHPDISKNRHLWRMVLEVPGQSPLVPDRWEEVATDHVIRTLYPYIDRWSKNFLVRFPKTITDNTDSFDLKMVGVPADSQLTWNLEKLRQHAKK